METTLPQMHYSDELKPLIVSSTAFDDRTYIPIKYTADGANINPPLQIDKIPHEAKSLALIVEDPDALPKVWIHWILWNIPPSSHIHENTIPGTEGMNDFGKLHYGGPCPPSGTHLYHFKVYALDSIIELKPESTKAELEHAMSGKVIAYGELTGKYKKAF